VHGPDTENLTRHRPAGAFTSKVTLSGAPAGNSPLGGCAASDVIVGGAALSTPAGAHSNFTAVVFTLPPLGR
jgi:hypothetical protein